MERREQKKCRDLIEVTKQPRHNINDLELLPTKALQNGLKDVAVSRKNVINDYSFHLRIELMGKRLPWLSEILLQSIAHLVGVKQTT